LAIWQALAQRVHHHLLRDDVAGIVVTHGTDTMEETAYLLQRVLAPNKPVVLTGAMRPASSRQADGPRNLADAVAVASEGGAHGGGDGGILEADESHSEWPAAGALTPAKARVELMLRLMTQAAAAA